MTNRMKITQRIEGQDVGANDLASIIATIARDWTVDFASGTGTGQFDVAFMDTRALTTSQNDDIDLRGGSVDPMGVTLAMVEIRFIAIKNNGTVSIGVGGTVTNQITGIFSDVSDRLIIPAGGSLLLGPYPDGAIAITAGTADLLRIANLSGSVAGSYDIIVLGVSA